MKKILFISSNKVWGGSEELWFRSAKIALERGLFVGVYTFKDMLPQSKIEELQQYQKIIFFYRKKYNILKRIYNRLVPSKWQIHNDFNKNALKWQPDIVLFSHGNNFATEEAISLFRNKNIKYCTVGQAATEYWWPQNKDVFNIRENFNNSEANYFVSQANLKLTELQIGCKILNSKVIRNPFNVPYDAKLDYPDSSVLKLACVARYHFESKGQDILLEVLNQQKWRDRNIEVNLYGSGENEEGIKNLINYLGLTNVFVKGFTKTIDIWKENHALILPSRYEGLPLAIVEAMLCGRFAITTNVSGNGEVIIDGENGFIAEVPRMEYLNKAMERAWNKKDKWEEIGNKAKHYIKTLIPESPETVFLDELLSKI
ncbi:MAG: glycosyltransferase [Fusobacteriaceae bacterium]|jgi:glycosyltransferase involved in cell wall biosynthesis|nr:glycosyltransferase [Fusobacteriaceae bacterium]